MSQHKVNTLYVFIENELIGYGFSPQYVGFQYLSHAIHWTILDKQAALRLSTNLYPRIAKPFGVSVSAVEHGIRNLISMAWRRKEVPKFRNLFVGDSTPPTNAHCIGILARAIRMQYFLARQQARTSSHPPDNAC